MNVLDACIKTRNIAADTFEETLREVLQRSGPISEVTLRDVWLDKLRLHESIFTDGWYTPPPHGMFVQFATDNDASRLNQPSNRPPAAWPRNDIFLDRNHSIVNVYASPVERETGMIGDFGMTLYFGKNAKIKNLIKRTLAIDYQLYEMVKPGMEVSTLVNNCAELLKQRGLYNAVATVSDPAGTDIGHSIPASGTGWSDAELKIIKGDDRQAAADTIAGKRYFMSTKEHHRITENEAFTIEPRPLVENQPDLPMISFHTIVVIKNGRNQLITGFDDIFRLAGMDYMLEPPA